MAKELSLPYVPASGSATGITTLYVSIRRPSDGFRWYTVTPAWEAYNSAHVANGYAIALVEEGSTGEYYADFPPGITAAGRYGVVARRQVGASPAWPADEIVGLERGGFEWSGSAVVVPGDVLTIKGQAVTCAAPVTVLASVGTATTSTAQTGDAYAPMAALAGWYVPATVSTATSATSFVVAFTGTQSAAGLAGLYCSFTTAGRSPEKLAIATATAVDSSHITLTFTSPGFGVAPVVGDSVLIG